MFDTYVTVVGNVLTAPDWRRTTQSKSLVANFKVASTARRLDREKGQWVDGNSLRLRVNCWRKLAEGVAASIMVGDPVIVVGRLYTRDWTDAEGNNRTLYEMEAIAVGHDLSRGRGRFVRNRPALATSSVEDAEAETRVRGEATDAVPETEAPTRFGEHPFDDASDPDFGYPPAAPVYDAAPPVGYEAVPPSGFDAALPAPGYDAAADTRGGGFGTRSDGEADDELDPISDGADADAGDSDEDADGGGGGDGGDDTDGGGVPDIDEPGESQPPTRRRRRERSREPVPA